MDNERLENPVSGLLDDVDVLIHEPARLKIMSLLHVVAKADFLFVLNQTGLSKGNLSSHMRKLEEAGYINVEKKFVSRKPLTILSMSKTGKKAFSEYIARMQRVVNSIQT